ncbi:MAG: hypothetical protein Q9168_005073 [Polycauliona sp. 1 TL-2023]
MQPRLSGPAQQVIDEMKKTRDKALATRSCGFEYAYDSDSSDDEDHDRPVPPVMGYKSTKKVVVVKPGLPTIVEERESVTTVAQKLTFSVTIRSNSLHTRTNISCGRVSETVDQAKLETTIAKIDEYLDAPDKVRKCYRERLWKIREAFDDIKRHQDQSNIPQSLNTLRLGLEVQVAYQAQANVRRFTHLLLHGGVDEETKGKLRRYLAFSESRTNPRLDENTNLVLDHLKAVAASIEKAVNDVGLETAAAIATAKEAVRKRDVDELHAYLQYMLLLRYNRNTGYPRLNVKNLNALRRYARWRSTRDKDVAASLAKRVGLHPIELDGVLGERLDSLLQRSPVDAGYIQARLGDLDYDWHWANEHNPLANLGQFAKLAGQFCDDRAQFDLIFPGDLVYINPDNGTSKSNTKARVRFGMIQLHCHYFAKLRSPDDFELSKSARSMVARAEREEMRERKGQQQVQRQSPSANGSPSPTDEARLGLKRRALVQFKKYAKPARDSSSET